MGYSIEIDKIDRQDWHRQLGEFDDANIFQTWAYGSSRWGDRNLSHAVVRHNGAIVGLAQVMLLKVPMYGAILGYVIFGPVWQRRGGAKGMDHYRAVIRALGQEYVARRGLALRLRPWTSDLSHEIREAMTAEDAWREVKLSYATYVLDLTPTLADLRQRLDKKWRANLRKADAQDLQVIECFGQTAIDIFSELIRETQRRKHYTSQFMEMFEDLYSTLPETFRPHVFVCESNNKPVAAAIISIIGDRAFYLNGATSISGLKVRAGYCLQWHVVRLLKEMGSVRWYDLYGGLDKPGVKRFKRGIIGARASEIVMPEFQATGGVLSACLLSCATSLYGAWAYLNGRLGRLRQRRGSTTHP